MRFIYSKIFFYFSALFFVAVILVFLQARGWLKPVQSAIVQAPRPFIYVLSGVGHSFGSFFSYFSSVGSVNRTNATLAQQVRDLQQENATLQGYRLENDLLKKELNYRSETKYDLLSANVIAKDPTDFSQAILLNVGSRDGVAVGQPVLAQGVLIGQIISADTFTSKAMLVTDPQSHIDAQIAATGDTGILKGDYGSGIILDLLPQEAKIQKDQIVVTTGRTDKIPKGLLIGTIGVVQSQKGDLVQKATVVSSTDLKGLNFLSVLIK